LRKYFRILFHHFGPQRWWPARTRLEVILGAILTQNTGWLNAARALRQLRMVGLLKIDPLRKISAAELALQIRSAGFYRQKATTIHNFLDWLDAAHAGSLARLFARPADEVRPRLLGVKGIGPETADAILLYAGRKPAFVADAYTRRILTRHGLLPPRTSYEAARLFLHQHLPPDHALFNEFHALLVATGKRFCVRNSPRCDGCPLRPFLPSPRPLD
jgi:endonuclease-3 related protein